MNESFDLLEETLRDDAKSWARIHPENITPYGFNELKKNATTIRELQLELIQELRKCVESKGPPPLPEAPASQYGPLIAFCVTVSLVFILGLFVGFLLGGRG